MAALTSAFPGLNQDTVVICLVILAVVTVLNLRGLGDAARAFRLPTMVFIVGLLVIIVIGLHVLNTEYASVAEPLVAFIDQLCEQHDKQIVVLIPVVLPDRLRYEFLHNHHDLVLSAALRGHPDVVGARVSMPLEPADGEDPAGSR